jgi:hypothetical protein
MTTQLIISKLNYLNGANNEGRSLSCRVIKRAKQDEKAMVIGGQSTQQFFTIK